MAIQEPNVQQNSQPKNKDAADQPKSKHWGTTSSSLDSTDDLSQHTAELTGGKQPGLKVPYRFATEGTHPFDELAYEYRTSRIAEPDGTVVFEMKNVEVPKDWSQLATDIVVSKYFRKAGLPITKENPLGSETSAKQVVYRLAHTMRSHGEKAGYFASSTDAEAFEMELAHLLINQKGAFNSPVWFNCGLWHEYGIEGSGGSYYWNPGTKKIEETTSAYKHPQCSACFIQSVNDDLMSIFDLVKNEAKLFKYGSGTGTNFSRIRGHQEKLSGGGTSSGLMSFLEVLDRGAGATKSGGTTRRAAKMVTLNMDHPEILDFVTWKQKEERKVKVLIEAGYPADFNGEAYRTVSGQNSNNSVRISDAFMRAYLNKDKWQTTFRTTGEVADTYDAEFLMDKIADAAWECADPGVQFDDLINDWNTCLNTDRIYGSNPCSEYHFLDNTACNLASINLMKFLNEDGTFDIEGYRHACRIFFIAQEIIVDFASYPTEEIARNSHAYRPLGLGYANLGTLLMVNGLPYDSDKARAIAAALTAIMCGHAYKTSAEMAAVKGTFSGYPPNESSMLRVMRKHRDAAYDISESDCPAGLLKAARQDWDEAVRLGELYGYRNAQATVLAPTGTIALLMDCDTTGIEPDFSLVKWKKLAGGGYFKIINHSMPRALKTLGYTDSQIDDIQAYVLGHGTLQGAPGLASKAVLKEFGFSQEQIETAWAAIETSKSFNEWTPEINPAALKEKGFSNSAIEKVMDYVNGTQTVEGAPHLKLEHYAVFDCANKCGAGERFIEPMAHVKVMAATQPFLSGAISKTVNLPNEATRDEIKDIYVQSWQMGLKCVALYRDGSKHSQVLNSTKNTVSDDTDDNLTAAELRAQLEKEFLEQNILWGGRRELPQKRSGFTVNATVSGHKLHLRTGEYADGTLGEIFVDMFKEGAAYRSLLNCFAVAVSLGLQYGVPLDKYVNAFTFTRFEPCGVTDHPNVKMCTSIVDYIFRVLGMEYLNRTDLVQVKPESQQLETLLGTEKLGTEASASKTARQTASTVPVSIPPAMGNGNLNNGNGSHSINLSLTERSEQLSQMMGDAPFCSNCGSITIRNGSCYRCDNCGNSEGCS